MAGCPHTLVDIALSYAPSDYPSEQYIDGVLPYDNQVDPAWARLYAQPYPVGASSCAIFLLANYARAGFRAPGIGEPYHKYLGQGEALLISFGKSKGALETNPDPATFQPGDVFHIGTGLGSHWGMVVNNPGDGTIESVDGGQPGIARRVRTIVKSGGIWALSSPGSGARQVLHVIRADKLDVPCTGLSRGWIAFGVAILTATSTGAFVRWLIA